MAAGGGFIDRVFNIDMRLLIPESKINNIATRLKTNAFITNPVPLDSAFQPTSITTVSSLISQLDWISFPLTLIDLTDSTAVPGLAADEIGWYMYAGGFFGNNTAENAVSGILTTRSGVSLLEYSGIDPSNPTAPVVIPKNSSDESGNQVQAATLFGDITGEPYVNWQFIFVKTQLVIESTGTSTIVYTSASSLANQVIDIFAQAFASLNITGAGVDPPKIINDKFIIISHNPTTRTIGFNRNIDNSFQANTPLYIFKGVLKPNENPWYFVPKSVTQGGVTYLINSNGINSAIVTSPWTGAVLSVLDEQNTAQMHLAAEMQIVQAPTGVHQFQAILLLINLADLRSLALQRHFLHNKVILFIGTHI